MNNQKHEQPSSASAVMPGYVPTVRSWKSLVFQWNYCWDLFTGDGFRVKISLAKVGLIFRIWWGPYKKSRHLIIFIGVDTGMILSWRVRRLLRKATPEQRLALQKALHELGKGI